MTAYDIAAAAPMRRCHRAGLGLYNTPASHTIQSQSASYSEMTLCGYSTLTTLFRLGDILMMRAFAISWGGLIYAMSKYLRHATRLRGMN